MTGLFGDLPRGHYAVIYADPPWHWKPWAEVPDSVATANTSTNRNASRHYGVMGMDELALLPIADLAADDCVLFMWFTWPLLEKALPIISAWGLTYKTCAFDWMKADVRQIDLFREDATADMKLGFWTRSNTEACLLATRGHPKRLNADIRMGIIEKPRAHSRKPDCVYERIERLVTGPYIELFARSTRKGWDSWGNETKKFGEVA